MGICMIVSGFSVLIVVGRGRLSDIILRMIIFQNLPYFSYPVVIIQKCLERLDIWLLQNLLMIPRTLILHYPPRF